MGEYYAIGSDGKKYATKKEYQAARFQKVGTAAAVRANINRKVGGNLF